MDSSSNNKHLSNLAPTFINSIENNDITSTMKCINEVNDINGKSFFSVIGMLTRGLDDAISDLSISSVPDQSKNDRARGDLNYVISLTDNAAKTTLDMAEKSSSHIQNIAKNSQKQGKLIENYLSSHTPDQETSELLQNMLNFADQNSNETSKVNKNISEIVLAQNFQDLASQSITKAINIVKDVENSLVALTQYASLLSEFSRFSDKGQSELEVEGSEEIKSKIGKFNSTNENDNLNQNEVDNLLSSLGF